MDSLSRIVDIRNYGLWTTEQKLSRRFRSVLAASIALLISGGDAKLFNEVVVVVYVG